eukprot:779462-Rhodomonas_salina.1
MIAQWERATQKQRENFRRPDSRVLQRAFASLCAGHVLSSAVVTCRLEAVVTCRLEAVVTC